MFAGNGLEAEVGEAGFEARGHGTQMIEHDVPPITVDDIDGRLGRRRLPRCDGVGIDIEG